VKMDMRSATGEKVNTAGPAAFHTETAMDDAPSLRGSRQEAVIAYPENRTLGAAADFPQLSPRRLNPQRQPVKRGLALGLLKRALGILDGFDSQDVVETQLNMEALRGVVLELWEGAQDASQYHQDILALVEEAILSTDSLEPKQIAALREAMVDLENSILVQPHVDSARRQLIACGFSPLALLGEIEHDDTPD
jgi:hypothetical protein